MGTPTRIPARVWKIAAVTGAGSLMAMLDATVANLAVEAVREDFLSTLDAVQWIVTGYLAALAVSLPAAGWLGTRLGFGHAWMWAVALFVAGSVLCALAPTLETLVVARIIQGLGAGLMIPLGQAVVASAAGPDQLGRIFGALGSVVVLGPAIGPALGGALLDLASWRWLFWINVPIGAAALAAAWAVMPKSAAGEHRAFDPIGFALLAAGLALLLYGTGEMARGSTLTSVTTIAAALVLCATFTLRALRVPNPLVDLGLLRRRAFAAAAGTTLLTGANNFAGLFLIPLYLHVLQDRDITETGLLLLVMGAGSGAVLYLGGRLTDRHGAGLVALVGAFLLVVTAVPFAVSAALPLVVLIALLFIRGIGMALTQMPATTAAYGAVGAEHVGDASTLVNIGQRAGGAVGAAVVVVALSQAGGASQSAAYQWAFAAITLFGLLAVGSTLSLRRDTRMPATVAPS